MIEQIVQLSRNAQYEQFLYTLCLHLPVDIIGIFIESGLDVDRVFGDKDNHGKMFQCPDLLRIAIHRWSVEMIKLLDKYKFDFQLSVRIVYNRTKTIFLTLCEEGFVDGLKEIKSILETRSNFSYRNRHHKLQSKKSSTMQQYSGTKYKLKFNANLSWINNAKLNIDKNKNNGLHLAVTAMNFAMMKYLLENVYFTNGNLKDVQGMKIIKQTNKQNETPLVFACQYNSHQIIPIFKLLLDYSNNKKDLARAMYNGACNNNVFILKFMLEKKLGIGAIKSLNGAITKHNVEAVEILCKFDEIDVNAMGNDEVGNKSDNNSLQFGAEYGNREILKILLRKLMKDKKVCDVDSWHKCLDVDALANLKEIAQTATKSDDNQCVSLVDYLLENYNNYFEIAMRLRYDIYDTIRRGRIPNNTVTTDFYHQASYPQLNHNNTIRSNASGSSVDMSHSSSDSDSSSNSMVDRWTIHEALGYGAFGRVDRGTDNLRNGMEVALKFISVNKIIGLQNKNKNKRLKIVELIVNEIDTMHKIDHKNVIKLFAYNLDVDDSGTILLVFEYAQCGELYRFLAINKYFNDDIAKTYFEQILNALEICHAMGIIHRDIKPQNILLDSKYQIKIADFGLSTYDNDIKNKNTLFVGTRGYMSPELASPMIDYYEDETDRAIYKEITPSCDIFSLAVILWQMLNGIESMPFDEATSNDGKYAFIKDKDEKMFWKCHYNCRIIKKESSDCQRLLTRMFTYNPDDRIGISDIRKSDWYTGINGYNGDEKAQLFFEQLMRGIHYQLMIQQNTMARETYDRAGALISRSRTPGISRPASERQTKFAFSQLKLVICGNFFLCMFEPFLNFRYCDI